MKLRIVRSKKPKFKDALFLYDDDVGEWFAKVYGHEGQDVEGNAKLILRAIAHYSKGTNPELNSVSPSETITPQDIAETMPPKYPDAY